jgi:hypothetical protein
MATAAAAAPARHVVAVPYPGRGHINPMLVVCSQLAAADSTLTFTVVVTEEWHDLLDTAGVVSTLPERVRFATIPNVIPSERGRGADPIGFIEAVNAKMGEPVERLLDQLMLERKPEAIVADTYLTWGLARGAGYRCARSGLWQPPSSWRFSTWTGGRRPMPVKGKKVYHQNSLSCHALIIRVQISKCDYNQILPAPKIFHAKNVQCRVRFFSS